MVFGNSHEELEREPALRLAWCSFQCPSELVRQLQLHLATLEAAQLGMAESGGGASRGAPEQRQRDELAEETRQETHVAAAEDQQEQTAAPGVAAAAAAANPDVQPEPAATAAGPLVMHQWESAVDLNSGATYWFNRATGERQWHPPPGWAAPAAGEAGGAQPAAVQQQQKQQQPHSGAPPDGQAYAPGLYYYDVAQQLQGPFELEQLRQWRAMLPLDLPVLRLAEAQPASGAAVSSGEAGGSSGSQWEQHVLADLLGDGELLRRFWQDHPESVR